MILQNSSKPLREPASGDQGSPGTGTLSPDQQKIAAAVGKVAAAEPAEGDKPKGAAAPRPVRSVIATPPAKVLEGDFTSDDDPEVVPDDKGTAKKVDDTKAKAEADAKAAKEKADADAAAKLKADDTNKGQIKVGDTAPKPGLRDSAVTLLKELGYTEEEALKQMSNPALELTTKALKELKDLRGKKPESYLQHPNAYILQPEFEQTAIKAQRIEAESLHWKQQLLAIRAGKPWQTIKGYTKDGEMVLDGPFKATDEAEVDVQNAFNYSIQEAQNQKAQLNQLQQTFTGRLKADADAIQAELAKRFEWVADPTKLETKIEVDGIGSVPIKKIIEDFKGLLPSYHHNNIVTEVAANMFVALQVQGKQIRELLQQVEKEKKLKKDVLTAEPALDGGDGGKGKTKDEMEFDTEGLPT